MRLHFRARSDVQAGAGVRSVGDRGTSLPRWALDGGNGSVVTVGAMSDHEIAKCWSVLKSMLSMWGYSDIQASDLVEFMETLEVNIQD
jgi:hypothetical protein